MKVVFSALLFFVFPFAASAQLSETEQLWNQPTEPFKIAGNIYYVGASDVTSYLITTSKGHILLDSGFRETVPQITANVAKLGFKLDDVKYLISSHAHNDHAAGIAELKKLTKAKLLLSEPDAQLMARGGRKDPNFGDAGAYDPAIADATFTDGKKLKLGGTEMVANVTPGHTKGCTTWTTTVREDGRDLNVIFVCSTSSPGYTVVGNEAYPEIASDYESTFRRMKAFDVDIFLSSHASAYDMHAKRERQRKGAATNPFIDPTGFLRYIETTEQAFRKLQKEQSERKSSSDN